MLHFLWMWVCGMVALYCAYSVWHFSRLVGIAKAMNANARMVNDTAGVREYTRFSSAASFWRFVHLLVGAAAVFQIFG